jgi:carbon storage regulator
MLVLARKRGEWVTIGQDIRVVIVESGRNVVRLGIEAPRGVKILRDEFTRKPKRKQGGAQ